MKLAQFSTREEPKSLQGHQAAVRALAFSPDGKTLASGSNDREVRLWDVTAGKTRDVLQGHKGLVLAVATYLFPAPKTRAPGTE